MRSTHQTGRIVEQFQVAGWQFGVETKNGWIVESGKERFENEI